MKLLAAMHQVLAKKKDAQDFSEELSETDFWGKVLHKLHMKYGQKIASPKAIEDMLRSLVREAKRQGVELTDFDSWDYKADLKKIYNTHRSVGTRQFDRSLRNLLSALGRVLANSRL